MMVKLYIEKSFVDAALEHMQNNRWHQVVTTIAKAILEGPTLRLDMPTAYEVTRAIERDDYEPAGEDFYQFEILPLPL